MNGARGWRGRGSGRPACGLAGGGAGLAGSAAGLVAGPVKGLVWRGALNGRVLGSLGSGGTGILGRGSLGPGRAAGASGR